MRCFVRGVSKETVDDNGWSGLGKLPATAYTTPFNRKYNTGWSLMCFGVISSCTEKLRYTLWFGVENRKKTQ